MSELMDEETQIKYEMKNEVMLHGRKHRAVAPVVVG